MARLELSIPVAPLSSLTAPPVQPVQSRESLQQRLLQAWFHPGHGDVIRLLRVCGLEVEDLVELRPEAGAVTRYPFVTLDWPGNGHR